MNIATTYDTKTKLLSYILHYILLIPNFKNNKWDYIVISQTNGLIYIKSDSL